MLQIEALDMHITKRQALSLKLQVNLAETIGFISVTSGAVDKLDSLWKPRNTALAQQE